MTIATDRTLLLPRQMASLAAMGAFYWFVAALVVRWTAADWTGSEAMTALVFAMMVVATVPALLLGMKVAGVGRDRAQIAATVMTGTAALLDGVALTGFRTLYGTDQASVLSGAAAILWGVGVALVLGIVLERR